MTIEDGTARRHRIGFGAALGAVAMAAALGVLAQAALPAFAETDPGSIGVRLIDVPAQAADDARARQYIVDHLEPGTTIERRFEISNTTTSPATVEVYPAAASIVDGTFLGAEGRTANDLSSRTTIGETSVVIPAGSTVVDTVTIAIPADAAPGEQYGAIWVEARGPDDQAVEIVNRVGIRMYVSVGGSNAPASSLAIEKMTASRDDDGAAVVTATIHNTGGRAIDATASVTLAAVGATLTAGPYASTGSLTVAPGDTAQLPITITDDIDAGPWLATAVVTSGTLAVSAVARLTFPDAGAGTPVTAVGSDGGVPTWAWIVLLAVLVLLAALAAYLIRRRTIARGRTDASTDTPAAQEAPDRNRR